MALLLLLLVLVLVAGVILVGARLLQPAPDVGHLGHLAYTTEDGLYVADWDGRNPRRILSLSQLPANIPDGCRTSLGGPTWSPDGRHLAVQTDWNDDCAGSILITDAEGSSMTTIRGAGWQIAWSPDSRRIVTWISFWESIAVYGIEGDRQAFIPLPGPLRGSGDHDPSWTFDGAAALIDDVVLPLDGTPPYRDPSLARFTSRSRVSPDRTMIADPRREGIVVAALDGSSERVLGSDAPSPVGSILWSPTGDRIAFNGDGSLPGIVDVATGATTTLDGLPIDGSELVGVERFSPEGDRILLRVAHAPYRNASLWSVQADGSGARQLVDGINGGDWQWLPPGSPLISDQPSPVSPSTGELEPVTVELELHLQTWSPDPDASFHEVAVYADGRVIWDAGEQRGYVEQRLTPEGVEQLRSRAISTGLFERELALGIHDVGWGNIKVRRGDLSVRVAWGQTSQDVSGLGLEDRFVAATSAQAVHVTELESYLRDPTTWGLPDSIYVQPEITPFVSSQFWVGFDRGRPNLSNLPSPAREVVTGILEPLFLGRCQNISIDQAREIAQVLARAGIIPSDYDVRLGFGFDVPSPTSFVHVHPVLPHDVGTVCGQA